MLIRARTLSKCCAFIEIAIDFPFKFRQAKMDCGFHSNAKNFWNTRTNITYFVKHVIKDEFHQSKNKLLLHLCSLEI